MASAYTKTDILHKIEHAAQDMAVFYQQDFINYRGRTTDTDEPYTEVIAEWCCEKIHLLNGIPHITRASSYKVAGHDGIPDNAHSNREEELIAMAMFRQSRLPTVGRILDYQTPLKNKRTDRAGKIDLLAYDGTTLRILELKTPDSTETMLRCVLEGHTYLQTVDIEKLLSDFSLPPDTLVTASPFVFAGGVQHKEMEESCTHLAQLMSLLNTKVYYISEMNGVFSAEE